MIDSKIREFRYYFIYLLDEDLMERFGYNEHHTQIYAFTKDKELAKEFLNQRKENLFKLKIQDLTPYEAMGIEKRYSLSYLVKKQYYTSNEDNEKITIDIVATAYEHQNVFTKLSQLVHVDLVSCYNDLSLQNYSKISSKYLKSLRDMRFIDLRRNRLIMGFMGEEIALDQLEMMISIYSDLFR